MPPPCTGRRTASSPCGWWRPWACGAPPSTTPPGRARPSRQRHDHRSDRAVAGPRRPGGDRGHWTAADADVAWARMYSRFAWSHLTPRRGLRGVPGRHAEQTKAAHHRPVDRQGSAQMGPGEQVHRTRLRAVQHPAVRPGPGESRELRRVRPRGRGVRLRGRSADGTALSGVRGASTGGGRRRDLRDGPPGARGTRDALLGLQRGRAGSGGVPGVAWLPGFRPGHLAKGLTGETTPARKERRAGARRAWVTFARTSAPCGMRSKRSVPRPPAPSSGPKPGSGTA